ncbi:helix-turn-helix domain-containing protein [Propionispora hippei]
MRLSHKLTAEQFGKEFSVSKQTVSRWEETIPKTV